LPTSVSLSRVKTIVIYVAICEKKQRFEVIIGVHFMNQCVFNTCTLSEHWSPTQPVRLLVGQHKHAGPGAHMRMFADPGITL
jgi:hypothetical protein